MSVAFFKPRSQKLKVLTFASCCALARPQRRTAGIQRALGPLARNVCARACAMFAFSEQANLRFWLAEIWFLPPLLAVQQEVASPLHSARAQSAV
jgi:hypothetical protein